jgi:hypothetical protein
MKYETMTCNGKAIRKIMGWGMILMMISYDKDGNTDETLSGFTVPPGQAFKLILVTHDKSTFYENDRQQNCWSHKNDKATPQQKGEDTSLMVLDFLTTEWGQLTYGDECVL